MIKKRFSFIELIVVVSIIILILVILIPNVLASKKAAETVLCANNLRQFTTSYTTFARGNDGRYPCWYWLMDPNDKTTKDDKIFYGHPPQGHGIGLKSKLKGNAWIGKDMAALMKCETDETPELRIFSTNPNGHYSIGDFNHIESFNQTRTTGPGLIEVENSYGYNLNLSLYDVKMMTIPTPSEMLVNFDASSLFGGNLKTNGASKIDLTKYDNFINEVFDSRHGNKANMLFCDGHVIQGTSDEITDENLYSNDWRTTGKGYFEAKD